MTDENQNSFEDSEHDVFDDSEAQAEVTEETPATEEEQSTEEQEAAQNTGEKEDADATPADEKKDDDDQSEKMIPEHRFKAALKDVNDKLEAAEARLAQMQTQPAPDRAADPEGYDLHMRMETSKAIMSETHADYNETIRHYQAMEKANPMLAQVVAAHPIPAKHAYDIAKKDMEIRELSSLKQSDDWAQFQEFKKQQAAQAEAAAKAAAEEQAKAKQPKTDLISKVPNLNRATDVSAKQPVQSDDDDLFAGAL